MAELSATLECKYDSTTETMILKINSPTAFPHIFHLKKDEECLYLLNYCLRTQRTKQISVVIKTFQVQVRVKAVLSINFQSFLHENA